MKGLMDLAAEGHNRRYVESEYQTFRNMGYTHERACERVDLDPKTFSATLHKRLVRAS